MPRLLGSCFITALLAVSAVPASSGQGPAAKQMAPTPEYGFRVVKVFDHDPAAYTQGLVYLNGFFYEGTGQNGRSWLRKVSVDSGKVLQQVNLPYEFFGEGIAILNNKVVQLTWQSQRGFIYRLDDFKKLGEFSYEGEGWGLTTDGKDFLLSDGSASIKVLDGDQLLNHGRSVVKRRIEVRDQGVPVPMLNELEMVKGELYANVWQTDRIAVIAPKTGKVIRWLDLTGLLSSLYRREVDSVLNGIAFDRTGNRLFLTGKLWPKIFQIEEIRKK